MKSLLLTIHLSFASLLAENQTLFRSQAVLNNENDPNRHTLYGEFMVFFDLDCVTDAIIQEFLDLFECYSLNENIVDEYPDIVDRWIYLNKKQNCDYEDEIELEWEKYCIIGIEENEVFAPSAFTGSLECAWDIVDYTLWHRKVVSPFGHLLPPMLQWINYPSTYNPITNAPEMFDPNMDIIVMDSGIDFTHSEFSGIETYRIYDAHPGQSLFFHGTSVASLIVGRNYGLYPAALTQTKLLDVRRDNSSGHVSGDVSTASYDAVLHFIRARPARNFIVTMSFEAPYWEPRNRRVSEIKAEGAIIFAAAGNKNQNASQVSPASSSDAITVGAHDKQYQRANFFGNGWESNYGNDVDIWGPGWNIVTANVGGVTKMVNGTSFAAPIVAGIAANVWAADPSLDFETMKQKLLAYAVRDVDDRRGNTQLPRVQASCDEYGIGLQPSPVPPPTWDEFRQGSIEPGEKSLATYRVVEFGCHRRTGETTSSESIKSTVSCQDGETLVSCMIDGWHNIQGTHIDPIDSNTCIAGTSGGYSVFAVANCCTFPDGAVDSVFTVIGNDSSTQSVAECSSGTVTGCQIDYVSGATNNLRGAYPGPTQDLIGYDMVNQSSTEKQCTAEARSTSSIIRGGAQCIDTASEYELDCVTSSTLMGGSSARFDGGCPENYTLVSCGSFTPTANSLDDWHITDDGDCYIQQDMHAAHYSVSICCQLRYLGEIEATTAAPVTPAPISTTTATNSPITSAPITPAPAAPTSSPTLATYLGCYVDSSSRRFGWGYQTVANHDISVCVGLCIDGGYEYMGLQYDNECFCGNDLDYITSLGTRDPSGGQCGMNQQDTDEYNNYGCWGGAWTNCVYQIDATPAPVTPTSITPAPISGSTGLYPDKYNLIDPDPSCRYDAVVGSMEPQCPLMYIGPGDIDIMAIHPNIQERTDYIMRNMARLFPDYYVDSEWGWGGGSGSYAGDCDKPDTTPTTPFYFMSEAVQAARWNSFSGATTYSGCDRGNSTTYPGLTCNDAQTSHFTCCLYCQYNAWGQCGYQYRTRAIIQPLFTSNAWNDIGSEGIWSGNTALQSSASHCGMVFNAGYHHQGIGYYPTGSTTMVGIYDTEDWEDHVFPHGTHYDWDQDDYTFLLQFFGGKKDPSVTIQVNMVFLLYDGQSIAMDKVIGDYSSGFFRADLDKSDECEPYAFIAKDTNGNWWRLPEDERYYFATVDSPNKLILDDGSANCMENHYFNTGSEWVANGGDSDNLENTKNTANGCVGCEKIAALEAVYNSLDDVSPAIFNRNVDPINPLDDKLRPNRFGLDSNSSIVGLLLLTNIIIINVLICVCYQWKTKKDNYSKIKKVYFDDNDDMTESEQEEDEAI